LSDKVQEAVLEQLLKLTESVQDLAHGQKHLTERVAGLDDKVTRLDDKVARLDDKVTQLDERVTRLGDKVTQLGERVTRLDEKVTQLDVSVSRLDEKVTRLDVRATRLEESVVRIENDHGMQLGALFDAFSLRGDQVNDLREHMDRRFDSVQAAINFLIHRTNEHDNELMRLRKVK
jgi:chromosome segregation ATPase